MSTRDSPDSRAIVAVLLLALGGCRISVLHHDEEAAAAKAEEFLQKIVIQGDYAGGYALMREEDRRTLSLRQIEEVVQGTHPSGLPAQMEATAYEPVRGQAAIQIFLVGMSEVETFYYRVVLTGTANGGYAPQAFSRGSQPYPPSGLRRPLKKWIEPGG